MSLENPSYSPYINAKENVFVDGIRCYRADEADEAIKIADQMGEHRGSVRSSTAWLMLFLFCFGSLWVVEFVRGMVDGH